MALWQGRARRKPTGGRYRPFRKKRKFEIGREKVKLYRTRGRNQKVRILNAEFANVMDPKTGKTSRSKIVTVKESPSNPHFVTRNIITRGAVLQTDAGLIEAPKAEAAAPAKEGPKPAAATPRTS